MFVCSVEQDSLFRVLSGVLSMGNINFDAVEVASTIRYMNLPLIKYSILYVGGGWFVLSNIRALFACHSIRVAR